MTRDNESGADIFTPPAETAGLGPHLKGHAYFPARSPSYKTEGFSIHLLVTHPDTKATKNTAVVFHGEPDFEKPHAGSNVLSDFYVGGTGHEKFSQYLSCLNDPWGFGLNDHPLADSASAGGIDKWFATIDADLHHTDPTSSIRSKIFHITYGRDVNSNFTGRLQNGAPFLRIDQPSIDCDIDRFSFHSFPPLSILNESRLPKRSWIGQDTLKHLQGDRKRVIEPK
jgi:hypothetical protein